MNREVDAVRAAAIDVLLRVFEADAYLSAALDAVIRRHDLSQRARRFLTQLVYGTVRHKLLADHILARVLHQPLDDLPAPIRAILRMGVFQALFMDHVPFRAMVNTSVTLARTFGHAGTAKLANAVLRRVPQSLDEAELPLRKTEPARHLSVRHSIPQWLVENWLAEFGESGAENLCETVNSEAPVTVRANTAKMSVDELIATLKDSGYVVEKRTAIPEEITLVDGPPPARSRLFRRGLFLIQDPASMLPPHLVEPEPGQWILDTCAAPGSKTTHLAQLAGAGARIVAVDIQASKLLLVDENVRRLELNNIWSVCADAARPPLAPRFDRVLVDAPCSGLGILRRHPDLKWRVRPDTARRLQATQVALLRSAAELCKNGGLIVYSVCTFTREETEEVARTLIETEPVRPEDGPEWLSQWKIGPGQYRILPEKNGPDGFYLMRLRKRS